MKQLRFTPRRGHPRTSMAGAMSAPIERWIESQQTRFNCSRSMVIASACAFAGGLADKEETVYSAQRKRNGSTFRTVRQSRKRGTSK